MTTRARLMLYKYVPDSETLSRMLKLSILGERGGEKLLGIPPTNPSSRVFLSWHFVSLAGAVADVYGTWRSLPSTIHLPQRACAHEAWLRSRAVVQHDSVTVSQEYQQ